MNFAI